MCPSRLIFKADSRSHRVFRSEWAAVGADCIPAPATGNHIGFDSRSRSDRIGLVLRTGFLYATCSLNAWPRSTRSNSSVYVLVLGVALEKPVKLEARFPKKFMVSRTIRPRRGTRSGKA